MIRKGSKRDVAKEARWRKLIGDAARSGMSIREFCRRRGLNENLFYAWRRELKFRDQESGAGRGNRSRGRQTGPTFALVSADGDGELSAGIELVLDGSKKLRISRGVDAETLKAVVGALSAEA